MRPKIERAFPAAMAFVEAAARAGEQGESVSTWLGRSSPRGAGAAYSETATDAEVRRARNEAAAWGRFTRNFVVQGTAAEWALCWIGALRRRLWELEAEGSDRAAHRAPAPGVLPARRADRPHARRARARGRRGAACGGRRRRAHAVRRRARRIRALGVGRRPLLRRDSDTLEPQSCDSEGSSGIMALEAPQHPFHRSMGKSHLDEWREKWMLHRAIARWRAE